MPVYDGCLDHIERLLYRIQADSAEEAARLMTECIGDTTDDVLELTDAEDLGLIAIRVSPQDTKEDPCKDEPFEKVYEPPSWLNLHSSGHLWTCPNCNFKDWITYEFLAECGSPVCPDCDEDMKRILNAEKDVERPISPYPVICGRCGRDIFEGRTHRWGINSEFGAEYFYCAKCDIAYKLPIKQVTLSEDLIVP